MTAGFAKLRFLVVDDQAFIRNLVQGMLARLGATKIAAAPSGEAALQSLRASGADCVISDWNMRPVNGLELLKEIRTGRIEDVPANQMFIMLSGYATSSVVTAAANLDVSAYLIKPVSSNRLSQAIQLALSKPLVTKPASFYEHVELVPLPGTVDAANVSPWVEWVKAGRPVYAQDTTTFIRRQAVDLSHAPVATAAQIRLIRHKRVDRVQAGAILVEDFCDADGVVLLNAGVVLSEKMLRRLRDLKTEDGEPVRLWVGRI